MELADEVAMLVDELAERTAPQGDLDGAPALPPEPRLESRLCHGLLQHRQVPPLGKSRTGLRAPLRDQVPAPLPGQGRGALQIAAGPEQPAEHLGEQAIVP